MAKEKMDEFGLTYEVVVLDDDETRREFYESQSKQLDKVIQSVPQIFVNDTHVGGYQYLKKHLIHEFDYNQLQQITEIVTENLTESGQNFVVFHSGVISDSDNLSPWAALYDNQ